MRLEGWIYGAALVLVLCIAAIASAADVTNFAGQRFANGDFLFAVGVPDEVEGGEADDGIRVDHENVKSVCFKVLDGAELGCVERENFIPVASQSFGFEGQLVAITTGVTQNRVAAIRVPVSALGPGPLVSVRARSVGSSGFEVTSTNSAVFSLSPDGPPTPPTLIDVLIQQLESLVNELRALRDNS